MLTRSGLHALGCVVFAVVCSAHGDAVAQGGAESGRGAQASFELGSRGDDRLASAEGDATLRVWSDLAVDAVRVARASDGDAARTYAMVNVAIYDAAWGAARHRGLARAEALVSGEGAPALADPAASTAAAAHAVLVALYPDQSARFDAQLEADRKARSRARLPALQGFAWGASVGKQVVSLRADDGARPVESVPAGSGPGLFRAAWSNAQFRNLAPFAIASAAPYLSAPPPALDSVEYAADVAHIAILGNAAVPDPVATRNFQFWALPAGSAQPPGEWVRIALEVAEARRVPFLEKTRLLALVAMALSDVVAPTYASKLSYARWRPATAIREAGSDENPLTQPDVGWAPRGGGIGGNPEYTSGHSAFSAAGATVLAGFFCRDEIPFTHRNDGAPDGQARSYPSFSSAALEAGRSRVEGGVHFEHGNRAGLSAGRSVGEEVLANALLRAYGPTHFGSCPL